MQDLAFNFESKLIGSSRIIHADSFEWLGKIPENSFHAIVTDPPYGVKEYDFDQCFVIAKSSGWVARPECSKGVFFPAFSTPFASYSGRATRKSNCDNAPVAKAGEWEWGHLANTAEF